MTDSTSAVPTVVLVHGAFADAGSWAAVTELLLAEGIAVEAPGLPLRGLASDTSYIASVVSQIDGPVLAVAHSYGGAMITSAATQVSNIAGLVYVAAFAPAENETLGEIEGTSRDSALAPALLQKNYPTGTAGETAVELFVKQADFPAVFAGDLPATQAAVLAASQRPVVASAFDEKSGVPGWKTLPSWAVVATGDKAAGADVIRAGARRANAEITEIESSHLVMISQPRAVADVILKALRAVA
jgi:pimeloyl-ACP methyl ester carboxylesterase